MQKLTLTEMQAIANRRGGKCLSSVYIGTHHKLEWECANGHRWKSLPSSIKQGTWCPICVVDKKRGTLNRMRELA